MAYEKYYLIARLIAKSVAGGITQEEREVLDKWREVSCENQKLYDELHDHAQRTCARDCYFSFENRVSVADIIAYANRKSRRRSISRFMLRYGTAACVLAAAGVFLFTRFHGGAYDEYPVQLVLADGKVVALQDADGVIDLHGEVNAVNNEGMLSYEENGDLSGKVGYNELIVGRGHEYQVRLADGTRIHLNSDTRLRYPVTFNNGSRRVTLTGEAYFEVAADPAMPFVVDAGAYGITVLGTEFNVSNYPDDPLSRTVLVEGSVAVSSAGSDEEFILRPGEAFLQDAAGVRVETVDAGLYTAWTEGKLRYYEERLDVIMTALGRCYDLEVVYSDEGLKDVRLSLFANRGESVEPLLRVFNEHGKINVRMEANTLYVSKGR